jgi:hypothetical protein
MPGQTDSAHAASRNIRAHRVAGGIERDWSAHDRHVSAFIARHRSPAQCFDGGGAIHHLRLSHRICNRANFLWAGVRPTRPQADPDCSDRALLYRESSLLTFDIDRNAHSGARFPGTRRLRRHRSSPRDRARHLFRRPGRTRTVAHRLGDGARAGSGTDCGRILADLLRLASRVFDPGCRRLLPAWESCGWRCRKH